MFARTINIVALCLATMTAAQAADPSGKAPVEPQPLTEPSIFLFSDTQVSYRYQFPTVNPGSQILQPDGSYRAREAPKSIFNITHVHSWEYGTNFFTLDILKSGSQFPAGTTNPPGSIAAPYEESYGNTEAYGIYRGTLSLNALTKTKAFTISGLIKDVSLAYGMDANSQNDAFGSKKRVVVGGLNFAVDVPAGYLNLTVNAYKEWNRNGFNVQPNRDQSFDAVPEFEAAYSFPLPFTELPLSIVGFGRIVLPKGRGVDSSFPLTSNLPKGVEFLSGTNLVLDLGKLVYDKPNRVDAFIGFQYWKNKFGNEERWDFRGTEEKSFLSGVAFHIF